MRSRMFTPGSLQRMAWALCVAATVAVGVHLEARGRTAYLLNIYTVTCWMQNDPGGADEPYLKLNGNRIWTGPDCEPITTMYPSVYTDFWEHADLYIMEDDFGPDDTVGYVNVTGAAWGQGVITYYSYKWVDNLGWMPNYSMEYEVPA